MTHDEYRERSYLPELDGLRALSILLVISSHSGDGAWDWLAGALGVVVFFVLSGYLITRLALSEERDRGSLNVPAFFARRVFRLFPLYYAVLAVYCVLVFGLKLIPGKTGNFTEALPFYLFYFQEYVGFHLFFERNYTVPFAHSWSLGIEEKFYLVWPFLGFVAWRGVPTTRIVGTAALATVTALAPPLFGDRVGVFLFPYAQIAVGCLVALALDRVAWFDGLSWPRQRWFAWAVLGVFLAIQAAIPHVESRRLLIWYGPYILAYTLATAALLTTILIGQGPLPGLLRWAPLVKIGKLSYGMYLIHALMIRVVEKLTAPVPAGLAKTVGSLLAIVILCVACAQWLAVTIERPGIAMGRRLSDKLLRRGDLARSSPAELRASAGGPGEGPG